MPRRIALTGHRAIITSPHCEDGCVTDAGTRAQLLRWVADRVPFPSTGLWVRVAVDGVDGAGKSTFADELAAVLTATGRAVIRASVDDFHRVREERYRRGRTSWVGYWLDAFDYGRLRAELLDPLGPGGSGRYRIAVHELTSDHRLNLPSAEAPPGAVLVLDGVFLHRDELAGVWDFSVFLDVPFDVIAARMAIRDGTDADPAAASLQRYGGAQRHYLASCQPRRRATVVIDNSDLQRPAFIPDR
jgi:uridine kinase